MTADDLIAAARSYLGVKWTHLGRGRSQGVDCIGLILLSARDCGMEFPDPAPYEREPSGAKLISELSSLARRVPLPGPGDVAVFRTGIYAGHVGLWATHPVDGVPSLIHSYVPRRQVVEERVSRELMAGFVAAFRVVGE